MQKSKPENVKAKKQKMSKNNRILTIVVCIFLSVVLLAGAGFGIYFAVLESKTLVKHENVRMDEGVVRVISSYYKDFHIKFLRANGYKNASDSDKFWKTQHESGVTQEEFYLSSLKHNIAIVASSANLYYSSFKLSDDDKAYIKSRTESFLSTSGSEEEFNKKAETFGFDYDDFCQATEILYAANLGFRSIYGNNGEGIKTAEYTARLENYLLRYSRVKLIFISTDQIYDEEEKQYRDLTQAELDKRIETIERLKSYINAGTMLEVTFDNHLTAEGYINDGDTELGYKGYYFARGAEQTDSYSYPEIVDAALGLKVGESCAVDCGDGWAFVYRCEVQSGAYTDRETPGLADFYSNAALAFYAEDMEVISGDVTFKDKYYETDLIGIPANNRLFPNDLIVDFVIKW